MSELTLKAGMPLERRSVKSAAILLLSNLVPALRPGWVYGMIAFVAAMTYAAHATTPAYFGDDWEMMWPGTLIAAYDMGSGRWFAQVLRFVLADSGMMPLVTLFLLAAALAYSALLAADMLRLDNAEAAILACLMVTSPFLVEPASFNVCHITVPAGFLFATGVAALFLPVQDEVQRRNLIMRSLAVSALAVIALATYQSSALIAPILICLVALRDSHLWSRDQWTRLVVAAVAVAIMTVIGYIVSVRLSWAVTGFGSLNNANYDLTGSYTSTLAELVKRFGELGIVMRDFALGNAHGFYMVPKLLLIAAALAGIVMTCAAAFRNRSIAGFLLLAAPAALAVVLLPFILMLARDNYPVRYNALLPFGATMALLAVLALAHAKRLISRRAILASLAIVIIAGVFAHNVIAHGKRVIFVRDMALATRITERIESRLESGDREAGGKLKPVFLHLQGRMDMPMRSRPFGDGAEAPSWQKYFVSSIAECGVFGCQPGRLYRLFSFASADTKYKPLRRKLTTGELATVNAAPAWPSEGSVTRIGDFWLIKFAP